jgi:hypothetical protein
MVSPCAFPLSSSKIYVEISEFKTILAALFMLRRDQN